MTVAVFGMAACQNELSPVEDLSTNESSIKDYPYEMIFTAVSEGSTKTVLNDSQILWENEDAIKVFWDVEKSNKAVVVPDDSYTEATFTTKVEKADAYYAVYPYTEKENMTADGKIIVDVPAVQSGAFRDANIMLAKADGNTFAFKHLVGLVEFTTDVPGTVEITGAAGDVLTGAVSVTGFDQDGIPVYEVIEGSETISIDVEESGTYYAAFLPSAKLNCLSVKLTTVSDETTSTEYALSANSLQMGRGKLTPLGNITGQFGRNLFVKADADGNGDGKTWETALSYAQVATMLTSAEVDGKIFNFAAGEYKNDEQIYINKATGDELLKISFKGGYAASSIGTDLTKNDPSANVTTITGADGKRAFRIGRRIDMTVKGVTFSSGNGDGDVDGNETPDGGGILIADNDSGNSVLTFDNCTFSGNTSTSGGALVTKAAKVVLKGCTFSNNTATDTANGRGGAIFVNNVGTLEINGGTFTRNAGRNGGAIYMADNNTSMKIVSGTFTDNHATNFGGVIFMHDTESTEITGGTYSANKADQKGGAIYCEKKDGTKQTITISGAVIDGNNAGASGGAIFINGLPNVIIKDNTVISNNQSVAYGGGLLHNGIAGATYDISNTTFEGNKCSQSRGGAIYASNGTFTISKTRFVNNEVDNNNNVNLGGGAICARASILTISECEFTQNKSAYKGGAIYMADATQTLKVDKCTFDGNIAAQWGTGISVSDLKTTAYINNTIFKNNKSTNNYNVRDRGTVAISGKSYLNNCLFYGNYEANNKRHSSVIFDAENKSTSSSKAVGLLMNCTIIEANHDKAVGVQGTYAEAAIINNVLLSNSESAIIIPAYPDGLKELKYSALKSGGYNYYNGLDKNDESTYTLASDATEVANATYADGSELFSDKYMWKAVPTQSLADKEAISNYVKNNVTGGSDFITWLGTVGGLDKDLAGKTRPETGIYPGCYQ